MNLENNVQYINIEDIIPNRFQPRLTFDEAALNELAMSIKELGIIQPLVLRRLSNNKYEIIAGERRYKASQIAGLNNVPAIIADLDDNTSAEVALVENLQRKNLSAMEEAKSYETLLKRGYITQEQLAKRLGISQSTVANKIRLLKLCDEVQDALMHEKISERHARSLLQINDPNKQKEMLNRVIEDRLTVRQLDNAIKDQNIEVDKNEELINQIEELKIDADSSNLTDNTSNDEVAQMIFDSKKDLQDKYEIFDIPTAEVSVPKPKREKNKIIVSGNIDSVKEAINNIIKESKDAGFLIETEDYDFEDLYQLIIKIEK